MKFIAEWVDQTPSYLLIQVGEWLEHHNLTDEALDYYQLALCGSPPDSLAAFRAAKLLQNRKEFAEGAKHAKLAAGLLPDHAPSQYLASVTHFSKGDIEESLKYARNTLEQIPNHEGASLVEMRCLNVLGRWVELENFGRLTHERYPLNPEVSMLLALALLKNGNPQQAKELYTLIDQRKRQKFYDIARQIENNIS